jgi:hypothetical protein
LRAKSTQASLDAQAPVKLKTKRKSSVAQAVTTAPSRKAAPKPAQTTNGNLGLLLKTPVSQPASQSPKRKPSVAQLTIPVKSRKQTQKPAQIISGKDGLQAQTPALPTRQPASQARIPKQKVVVSTSAGKKTTRSKTPVQTRTVRQSKVSGS